MSVITDEMYRLKQEAMGKFKDIICSLEGYEVFKQYFELGYSYGMEDARKIQETIKRLAQEAADKL